MSQQEQNDKSQYFYRASAADFMKIPGAPVAYWAPSPAIKAFESQTLGEVIDARIALATGDNGRFIRYWHEVDFSKIGFGVGSNQESVDCGAKWFPINKGGDYRKWYGNNENVINWFENGKEIKSFEDPSTGRIRSHNYNGDFAFKESLTWSALTSGNLGVRYSPPGFMFVTPGSSAFMKVESANIMTVLSILTSSLSDYFLRLISATMNIEVGNILRLPYVTPNDSVSEIVKNLVEISKRDWDSFESSWGFISPDLISNLNKKYNFIEDAYDAWILKNHEIISRMKELETENNRLIIEAFGMHGEVSPDVSMENITLKINPVYRYGSKITEQEQWSRFREDTIKEIISYALGCMTGRFSLDREGLVYAQSSNDGIAELISDDAYKSFPVDDDGIIPLTDQEWFKDDACNRIREFVQVVWGREHFQKNLDFIAESLCLYAIKSKKGESSLETIRRYLSTQFYKDHLKTYKKRPIYWLFSSGKEKAFECLVYLHRYNEGTLARMRNAYVTPLMGKFDTQLALWRDELMTASGSQQRTLEKQIKDLEKKQLELRAFDEQLKHFADMRIQLDLDDGVKVNYGKFGNLLAEVKAITGDKE